MIEQLEGSYPEVAVEIVTCKRETGILPVVEPDTRACGTSRAVA